MDIKKPPFEQLKKLPREKVDDFTNSLGAQYANALFLETKSKEDIKLAEEFLIGFAVSMLQKTYGTRILNEYKDKGKSLVVCQEIANAFASDLGVRLAGEIRDDIKGMFDGTHTEVKHKIKRQE